MNRQKEGTGAETEVTQIASVEPDTDSAPKRPDSNLEEEDGHILLRSIDVDNIEEALFREREGRFAFLYTCASEIW